MVAWRENHQKHVLKNIYIPRNFSAKNKRTLYKYST